MIAQERNAQEQIHRRMRPLLGTFVEVAVAGLSGDHLRAAQDSAFAAIERVEALMSRYRPDSDVTRLNLGEKFTVDPWTDDVLCAAKRLRASSEGKFDIAVSGAIDLGGFAKGFAVDRAIDVLKAMNAPAAMVNAGGDLAAYGAHWPIFLRCPWNPSRLLDRFMIKDCAIAGSAHPYDPASGGMSAHPATIDPATGRPAIGAMGATVRSRSCMMADGLAKIAMIDGERSLDFLSRHGAEAMVVSPHRTLHTTTAWRS